MAKPRSNKFLWVTWLSRLMAGEISCEWAPWFKVRNEFEKVLSTPDLVRWKIAHNQMVREYRRNFIEAGKKVLSEHQVRFRYQTRGGLLLSGAADLIAISKNEIEVVDCKTGSPRDSDQVQVMIYMYCLPRARPDFKRKRIKGLVVYKDQKIEIPNTVIDSEFRKNLRYFIGVLEKDEEPLRSPSLSECQFCDIARRDCPERME